MGKVKGRAEYLKFKEGKDLTRKQAILANCYMCNGEEEGGYNCQGTYCPLYQYFPKNYKRRKQELKEAVLTGSFKGGKNDIS